MTDRAPGSMRRIMILGPPGSGKSTLARALGARLGLPVFHLDRAWWQPGWIVAPPALFHAEVVRLAALPAWIIDGNYLPSFAPRLRAADTVIVLDVATWRIMIRIVRRTLLGFGRVRDDLAPGCPERFDTRFLCYAWNWNRRWRGRYLELARDFPGRGIVLRGPDAVREFLDRA